MLSIKSGPRGASNRGISPQIVLADVIVNDVYCSYGQNCEITSGTEGKHGRASLHYVGYGRDYGIRGLHTETLRRIVRDCKKRLGKEYDVVLEKTHIHVEFQPK